MGRRTLRQNSSGPLIRQSTGSEGSDSQLEYFIDPNLGSDNFPGTEDQPLQTLAELCRRLSFSPVSVPIVATVLATTPVGDTANFKGITTTPTGSITLQGQAAPTGILLTIASVTNRSFDAGGPPWEIQTVGIDWTTETRTRLRVQSTGQIVTVGRILAADTVVVSGNCNNSSVPTALTTSDVLELEDDPPTIDAPLLDVTPMSAGFADQSLFLEDLDLRDAGTADTSLILDGESLLLGCIISLTSLENVRGNCLQSAVRNSRFNILGSGQATFYAMQLSISGCTFFSSAARKLNFSNFISINACYSNGVSFVARPRGVISILDDLLMENCADPLQVFQYAMIDSRSSSSPPTGSSGNTGSGVRTEPGGFVYYNNTKPDITGATDFNLGGATGAWATAPIVDTALNTGIIDK